MRVLWDEPKRRSNLAKHGLDFADAGERLLFEEAVVLPAHPGAGGQPRFKAPAVLDGRLVAAVVRPVGAEALALISLRPTSRAERRIYENAYIRRAADHRRGGSPDPGWHCRRS